MSEEKKTKDRPTDGKEKEVHGVIASDSNNLGLI